MTELLRAHAVECPYCGEWIELLLDLSAGSQSYVEDCQVCCRPIQIDLICDSDGELAELRARRDDE